MAKNREPEKTHEESSDDEEYTDSESDSESEPEPEPEPQSQQQTLSAKKPAPAPAPAPQKKTQSSSEEDSGSGSDTDSDDTPHPVALKKPAAANPATPPTKSTTAKRPAEKEPATKESKKSKKPEPAATSDSAKKNMFQRLFTDADVIVILQGMLDYQDSKKISPTDDMDDFFEFIKKKLSADFTKAQVQDKIRRLRKNYSNQKNHNRNLTKSHDREVYSLFCKIWGDDDQGKDMVVTTPKLASETAAKKTPTKKSNKVANGKADNVVGSEVVDNEKSIATRVNSYGLTAAERVLKIGAELFEGANAGVESAEKWRNLVVEDIEADLKKLDVVRAQMRLVLDALKSANQ